MLEFVVAISIILSVYIFANRKKGWSFPTKEDIDWASRHESDIERNS